MKYETGTFELRDNDIMRELTSAETNEVAGGSGASVSAFTRSGAGSSIVAHGSFNVASDNSTSASAFISLTTTSVVGPNNTLGVFAGAFV